MLNVSADDVACRDVYKQSSTKAVGVVRITVEVSRPHTIRHTHTHRAGRTPLDE